MSFIRVSVVILTISSVCLVSATSVTNEATEKDMIDCLVAVDFQCFKLRALTNMYTLIDRKSLPLLDGLMSLEYSGDQQTEVATSRALENKDWVSFLVSAVPKLVQDLSLKINLLNGNVLRISRSNKDNGLLNMYVVSENEEPAVVEGRKYILRWHIFVNFN